MGYSLTALRVFVDGEGTLLHVTPLDTPVNLIEVNKKRTNQNSKLFMINISDLDSGTAVCFEYKDITNPDCTYPGFYRERNLNSVPNIRNTLDAVRLLYS